jgi:hypothetical protein
MGGYDFDRDSDDLELDREIYLTYRSVGALVRDQVAATEVSGFGVISCDIATTRCAKLPGT